MSCVSVRRCCGANSGGGIGAFEPPSPARRPVGADDRLGGALHEVPEVVLDAAVQVQVVGAARHQPGARQPRQRVRDRRPLGADDLAEQPVGERQAEVDAARARRGPSGGRSARAPAPAAPRAAAARRSRGARRGRRRAGRPAAAARCVICGHGRARSANAASSTAMPRRRQRAPASRCARGCPPARRHARLQQVAGCRPARSRCGRRPGRRRRSRRPARAARVRCPTSANHASRSHSPTGVSNTAAVTTWRAASRIRRSNGVGQVVVGVEQEAVRRRELRRRAGARRAAATASRRSSCRPPGIERHARSLLAFVVPRHHTSRSRAMPGSLRQACRGRGNRRLPGRVVTDVTRLSSGAYSGPGRTAATGAEIERGTSCAWRFQGR